MNYEVSTLEVKVDEFTGRVINKKSLYMVNSLSFAGAEKLTIKYMEDKGIIGEVKTVSISDIYHVDQFIHSFLFKVKVIFETEDIFSGKLRKGAGYELISSENPENAILKVRQKYSNRIDFYSVDQSSKTPFIDIINYKF
jgi:uncharacterized protein YlxW (UPF0749 family)